MPFRQGRFRPRPGSKVQSVERRWPGPRQMAPQVGAAIPTLGQTGPAEIRLVPASPDRHPGSMMAGLSTDSGTLAASEKPAAAMDQS